MLAENTMQAGNSRDERLGYLFNRALTRQPNPRERRVLLDVLASESSRFEQDETAARDFLSTGLQPASSDLSATELAAWTAVARVVMNMHEFITRN